jgi:hypothetical protein
MKLLFSVVVLIVLVIPIIPLKIYATSDSDRGYNDGLDQPFLNKQRASDSYNRGWHDGHMQLTLQPLYKEGFKDGCTDQKAGILTYDSQGTLDESVYTGAYNIIHNGK